MARDEMVDRFVQERVLAGAYDWIDPREIYMLALESAGGDLDLGGRVLAAGLPRLILNEVFEVGTLAEVSDSVRFTPMGMSPDESLVFVSEYFRTHPTERDMDYEFWLNLTVEDADTR